MKHNLHGYYLEDLTQGQTAFFAKTITEADVILFAGISGDLNPIHINQEFAKESRFKERIVHGSLTASLISTVLGTRLPGPGAIFVSQASNFLAPVKIGDTVCASVTITDIDMEKKRVVLQTQCCVGSTTVLEGQAIVVVDRKSKIEV